MCVISSYGDGQGGMNSGPGGGGTVSGGESQFGGTLSAAAMVAAATATATATASVVALQERQEMNSQFSQVSSRLLKARTETEPTEQTEERKVRWERQTRGQ